MPWYQGPTLMGHLETVEIEDPARQKPFRLPVQWVNRPNLDFRGFAGTIASGVVRQGERVRVLPSGRESTVTRIVTMDGDLEQAVAGQAITLTLADEIDISRGDVMATPDHLPGVADQFEAVIVWMADEPLLPGRPYWLKIGTRQRLRDDHRAEVQGQRQHARAPGREEARAQRDRRLQHLARPGDRVRSLPMSAARRGRSS